MIKVFDYIEELDCFVVNPQFSEIADYLGITEWNEVVWIGRYFTLDNDFGEHWFDNWEEREAIKKQAKILGYESDALLIINPERFRNGKDGPCHTDSEIKAFWTDVLKSLHLRLETIIAEAKKFNQEYKEPNNSDYLPDLDARIAHINNKFQSH